MILVGALAVIAGAALWLYNDYEDSAAASYSLEKAQDLFEMIIADNPAEVSKDAASGFSYMTLDGEEYLGIISIPKLTLNLPVNRQWSYPLLKKTPCCFSGSIETDDFVIAAHNFRTHFGKIHTLKDGDSVVFTDVEGNRYNYYVAAVETVNPSDTYDVIHSSYDLTLFTCTYGGKTRVVIRCMLE